MEGHNEHAVVRLCECQAEREDQRQRRPNTSDVVSDFIDSRWRESRRLETGGQQTPSHRHDQVTSVSCNVNENQPGYAR